MITELKTAPAGKQDELVERVYRQTNLVSTYSNLKLLPPEAIAFIRHRDDLVGRSILDIGCGAGRLAVYLKPLVSSYAGVDISPYMVAHCRRHFPASRFVEGDMRDLSPFENCSFDTILAVSNVFDAVCHQDRLTVLTEVHRVLKPQGLLFFSAHNRNYIGIGSGPRLQWHRNPLTQIHLLTDFWKASRHHRQLKPQQRFESEYALINDSGNNYSSLHYYVSRNNQLRQLAEAGFEPIECLDSFGCILTAADCDAEFPSIHYVARKKA